MITFEYVKHLIYNIMSLEFNPRANDHKFYGTTIGQFTEEEKELFQIDLMMSIGFSMVHLSNKNDVEMKDELNKLGKLRMHLCIQLLEIPEVLCKIMGFEKTHEMIEESKYGFSSFLKSQDENTKEHMEEIEELVNTLKRDVMMSNISMN